jgi:hypothetical protein
LTKDDLFQDHLPPSPEGLDPSESSDAKFEFTKVESLLFAFHAVAKQDQVSTGTKLFLRRR